MFRAKARHKCFISHIPWIYKKHLFVSPLPGLGSWTWPWWCDSSRPPASKVVKIPLKDAESDLLLVGNVMKSYEIIWNLLKWRSHDANLEIWFQYVEIILKVFHNLHIPSPNLDPRLSLLQCQASSALIKGVSSFRSFSGSCSSNNLGFHQLPIFLLFPLDPETKTWTLFSLLNIDSAKV